MLRSNDYFNHHFSALKLLSQRKNCKSINVHLHALLIGFILLALHVKYFLENNLLSLLIVVCDNTSAVVDVEEQHR